MFAVDGCDSTVCCDFCCFCSFSWPLLTLFALSRLVGWCFSRLFWQCLFVVFVYTVAWFFTVLTLGLLYVLWLVCYWFVLVLVLFVFWIVVDVILFDCWCWGCLDYFWVWVTFCSVGCFWFDCFAVGLCLSFLCIGCFVFDFDVDFEILCWCWFCCWDFDLCLFRLQICFVAVVLL